MLAERLLHGAETADIVGPGNGLFYRPGIWRRRCRLEHELIALHAAYQGCRCVAQRAASFEADEFSAGVFPARDLERQLALVAETLGNQLHFAGGPDQRDTVLDHRFVDLVDVTDLLALHVNGVPGFARCRSRRFYVRARALGGRLLSPATR